MKYIYLFLIIILFAGCQSKDVDNREYLAKVNDEYLYYDDFKASFIEEDWLKMEDEEKEKYIEEWVQLTVLAQSCDKEGYSNLPQIRAKLDNADKKIRANTFIAHRLNSIKFSEDDLFNYYQLHKQDYQKELIEYKYQRIVIKELSKFNQAVAELKNDTSFKTVAIKYSTDAAGKNGGYMGYVSKKDVDIQIWNTLTELERYKWKSLKIGDEFLIVRWYEKRNAKIIENFSDVKDDIEKRYLIESRNEAYDELMNEVETSFDIEINTLSVGDKN